MTRIRTLTMAVLLITALVAAAAAPAAATHDETDDDGGVGDAFAATDGGMIDTARGLASGFYERAAYKVSTLRSDAPAAADSRDDAQETFNEHSDAYVQYLNDRSVHNGEVVEVTFVQDDDEAVLYIVGEYNESTERYEGAEAMNETERDVDHEIELRGMAADNAADELERFHDEFAEPNKDLTARYAAEMASKYKGLIDEPFTGGD